MSQVFSGKPLRFKSAKPIWGWDSSRRDNRARDTHWQIRGGRRTPRPNLKTINAIRSQSEKAGTCSVIEQDRTRDSSDGKSHASRAK